MSHMRLTWPHSGTVTLMLHNMTYFHFQFRVKWPFPAVTKEDIHSLTELKFSRGAGLKLWLWPVCSSRQHLSMFLSFQRPLFQITDFLPSVTVIECEHLPFMVLLLLLLCGVYSMGTEFRASHMFYREASLPPPRCNYITWSLITRAVSC